MSVLTVMTNIYNEEDNLPDYLDSLVGQTYQGFRVLFVDDGSTDRSLETISRYTDKLAIKVLRLPHRGLRMARAEGIRNVTTELCAVYDADEVLDQHCVERMIRVLERADVGAVGGYVVSRGDTWLARGARIVLEASFDAAQHPDGTAEHLPGGCLAFKTKLVLRFGGFEGGEVSEDVDLAWRLRKHGYAVVLAKDIIAYHKAPQTLCGIFKGGYKVGRVDFHTNCQHKQRFLRWHQMVKFGPLALLMLVPIDWRLAILGLILYLASFLYYVRGIRRPPHEKLYAWVVLAVKSLGWGVGFISAIVAALAYMRRSDENSAKRV